MLANLRRLVALAGAVALSPAELSMLKLFEERELELRFGDEYLAYKRSTPMLLGRRRKLGLAVTTGQ